MSSIDPGANDSVEEVADFWESRYSASERVWSGNVNQTLAAVVAGLTPGTALDLGCGEGGDVIWLAKEGWDATGVDVSETAVNRAKTRAAETAGVGHAHFIAADLNSWHMEASQEYDLIVASFLNSPVGLDREAVLKRAMQSVSRGGHFLVISHAPPEINSHEPAHHRFKNPQEELELLNPDESEWEIVLAETQRRNPVVKEGAYDKPAEPHGHNEQGHSHHSSGSHDTDDAVVFLRRR